MFKWIKGFIKKIHKEKSLKDQIGEKTDWLKWKASTAVEWCRNNKEAVIVFGPAIIGGIVEIVKISTKRHVVNEEKALKERYIYDRSTGHYYELKRQPKNPEWIQIDHRKQLGEPLGWILNDMRLLK